MPLSWFKIFIILVVSACISYYDCRVLFILLFLFLLAGGIRGGKYSMQSYSTLALFLIASLYFGWFQEEPPVNLKTRDGVVLTGIVETIPRSDGNRCSFILRNQEMDRDKKKVQVFCNFIAPIERGEQISLRGDLKLPSSPGNPGEFDYPHYLSYSGIYYLLSVKDKNAITVISAPGRADSFFAAVRHSGENIIQANLSPSEAAILIGMLLGKTDAMDPEQYQEFQKSGIVHIFSVSGLHIGFLLLLMTWLTSLARFTPRVKFAVTVFSLLLYGSIVAWPVSVMRAVIMGIMGLLAYYSGRENALLNGLGLAGSIIIIMDPFALFKISFQLSFMATWGLLYLFPLLKKRLRYKSRIGDLLLIPLSAQLAVLPLIAYHFNLFSPVSLLSNVLTTYLSGACVMLGLLTLMLAQLWPLLASIILLPTGFFIEMILSINNAVLKLPFAFYWVATPSIIIIGTYYMGLFLLVFPWQGDGSKIRGLRQLGLSFLLAFILLISLPASLYQKGVVELALIDVGQGDSILLKTPGGKFILVDGGGSQFSDPGSKKLLPYLHYRGIRKIDLVINTHPDIDHLQGLEKVCKELRVANIALPFCLREAEEYKEMKEIAFREGIPLFYLKSRQQLRFEKGCVITVLYPEGGIYSGHDYNNKSLVLHGQYGDFSFLLTGDVGKEGMREIMRRGKLKATAIKVPHHGSKGSLLPEFYREVNPHWAIISAGANNSFGHPHPSVLNELGEQGIKILRTDKNGAVVFRSDGRSVTIRTGAGNKLLKEFSSEG